MFFITILCNTLVHSNGQCHVNPFLLMITKYIHSVTYRRIVHFLFVLCSLCNVCTVFTLLCTTFTTKYQNSGRRPTCRANWWMSKIRIFQNYFLNLKKWCLKCPGKLQKHCKRTWRPRNRVTDYFLHYISVTR